MEKKRPNSDTSGDTSPADETGSNTPARTQRPGSRQCRAVETGTGTEQADPSSRDPEPETSTQPSRSSSLVNTQSKVLRMYARLNIAMPKPVVTKKFDMESLQKLSDRQRKFSARWPTSLEEARKRERERELARSSSSNLSQARSSSDDSVAQQQSLDASNKSEEARASSDTPLRTIDPVRVGQSDRVAATPPPVPKPRRKIFVKSDTDTPVPPPRRRKGKASPGNTPTPTPRRRHKEKDVDDVALQGSQEEDVAAPTLTRVSAGHRLKLAKRRGPIRRALRAIGRFLSNWCYPAMDTRDPSPPFSRI